MLPGAACMSGTSVGIAEVCVKFGTSTEEIREPASTPVQARPLLGKQNYPNARRAHNRARNVLTSRQRAQRAWNQLPLDAPTLPPAARATGSAVHARRAVFSCATYQRYVRSIPSRRDTRGCQPVDRNREESSSLRGVPSGFDASNRSSPE